MTDCEIRLREGAWYCKKHDCQMAGGAKAPQSCLKVRPISGRERTWLQKEQRRLGYRLIVGTISTSDRQRLSEIKALLDPS